MGYQQILKSTLSLTFNNLENQIPSKTLKRSVNMHESPVPQSSEDQSLSHALEKLK